MRLALPIHEYGKALLKLSYLMIKLTLLVIFIILFI